MDSFVCHFTRGVGNWKRTTPRRPVLSLPVSSYDNLNNTLAKYFDGIDGANIVPVGHIWKFDLEQHEKRNYGAK